MNASNNQRLRIAFEAKATFRTGHSAKMTVKVSDKVFALVAIACVLVMTVGSSEAAAIQKSFATGELTYPCFG